MIFHIIEKHCQQGVDYQTIHAGLLIEHLPKVKGRITGIESGGGILAQWMLYHHRQNPLYTRLTTSARSSSATVHFLSG